MTQVKFYYEKPEGDLDCEVFAFFPTLKHDNSKPVLFTSYMHIGQHSACSLQYVNECLEARLSQYQDLLNELISIGYKDLLVLNNQQIQCHRPPTKGEIKFGEGATHYRTFTVAEIGFKKGTNNLKSWFVCPIDKLRYYTK